MKTLVSPEGVVITITLDEAIQALTNPEPIRHAIRSVVYAMPPSSSPEPPRQGDDATTATIEIESDPDSDTSCANLRFGQAKPGVEADGFVLVDAVSTGGVVASTSGPRRVAGTYPSGC